LILKLVETKGTDKPKQIARRGKKTRGGGIIGKNQADPSTKLRNLFQFQNFKRKMTKSN